MTTITKTCLACRQTIKGRTDKKFCDDNCRNNYNNRLNSDASPLIRNINNTLRKNRRILEQLLTEHTKKQERRKNGQDNEKDNGKTNYTTTLFIPKEMVAVRGFHFSYYTHTYTNAGGETYYFCYDYGYKETKEDKNRIQVVKAIPEIVNGQW